MNSSSVFFFILVTLFIFILLFLLHLGLILCVWIFIYKCMVVLTRWCIVVWIKWLHFSEDIKVIGQGSGPLPYTGQTCSLKNWFHINDLPEQVRATVRLFTDDTIRYVVMASENDASLQKDLDNLIDWEDKWKMQFHPQKCSVLKITRNRNT